MAWQGMSTSELVVGSVAWVVRQRQGVAQCETVMPKGSVDSRN